MVPSPCISFANIKISISWLLLIFIALYVRQHNYISIFCNSSDVHHHGIYILYSIALKLNRVVQVIGQFLFQLPQHIVQLIFRAELLLRLRITSSSDRYEQTFDNLWIYHVPGQESLPFRERSPIQGTG